MQELVAIIARLWLFYLRFGGVKMLDKGMFVATTDLWLQWCSRLAEQAGSSSRADLLRNLVFLLTFDEELGDAITRRLRVDQISFRN